MPKVSIIVPVYNTEQYLEQCLDSLVNQTLKDIEIIVINDGSPDNSNKIIKKYEKKYPKKIKGYEKENGGLSDARNFGISKASGEYLAFLDSDDYVSLDTYEKLYNKAKTENFDMVVCNLYYVYDKLLKPATSNIRNDIYSKKQIKKIYQNIYPAAWNKIYARTIFDNPQLRFITGRWFEDVEFIYKILPSINSIGTLKDNFIYYVQRDNSITKTYDERLYDELKNWNDLIDFYKNNNIYNEYKKELEYAYIRYIYASFIKQCVNYNNKEDYNKAVNEAIKNVKSKFPKYRTNKYFYTSGIKGYYLLFFNKIVANGYYLLAHRKERK